MLPVGLFDRYREWKVVRRVKPSLCRSHAAELSVNWPQCFVVQAASPTDNRTPPFPKVAAFTGQPIPQSPFHAIGHLHGTVTLPSSFHRPDRGRDFAPIRSADSPIARNDIRGGSIPTARTNVSPTAHIRARRQPTTRMECVAPIPTSPGHQSKPSERVAEGILPESTGIHACDTTYSANRDGFATIRPGLFIPLNISICPNAEFVRSILAASASPFSRFTRKTRHLPAWRASHDHFYIWPLLEFQFVFRQNHARSTKEFPLPKSTGMARPINQSLQPTCYPYDYSTVNENGKLSVGSSRQRVARTRLNSALPSYGNGDVLAHW